MNNLATQSLAAFKNWKLALVASLENFLVQNYDENLQLGNKSMFRAIMKMFGFLVHI